MGKAHIMCIYSGLPPQFWNEFYLTAAHGHMKTTSQQLKGLMPWQLWDSCASDLSYLCEPGYWAFMLIVNKNNPKIYECSIKYILLGYNPDSRSYRCYDLKAKLIYSSYHVQFLESHKGHLHTLSSPLTPLSMLPPLPDVVLLPLTPLPTDVSTITLTIEPVMLNPPGLRL
jgi:hypothetical protein